MNHFKSLDYLIVWQLSLFYRIIWEIYIFFELEFGWFLLSQKYPPNKATHFKHTLNWIRRTLTATYNKWKLMRLLNEANICSKRIPSLNWLLQILFMNLMRNWVVSDAMGWIRVCVWCNEHLNHTHARIEPCFHRLLPVYSRSYLCDLLWNKLHATQLPNIQ